MQIKKNGQRIIQIDLVRLEESGLLCDLENGMLNGIESGWRRNVSWKEITSAFV